MRRSLSSRLAWLAWLLNAATSATILAACSIEPSTDPGSQTSPGRAPTTAPDAGATGLPAASSGDAGAPATVDAGPPGSPANDGGSPIDPGSPAPDAGGSAHASTEFAPYFPTWIWGGTGYAIRGLADLHDKAGLNSVTIAFVLSGGGCKADQGIEQNLGDVKAFLAAGGHVKASFGGADGAYLESQCSSAAALATAIGDFVDATGITDLDFDIEQDPVMTDAVNEMRGQALKLVQTTKKIRVAFTLAANPHAPGSLGGLTAAGLSVVTHAVGAGVAVAHVNLMTMDYGDAYKGQPMAPIAIGSLTDANAQLVGAIPGLTAGDAWAMLGVIAMIGKNDDAEIFTLADARAVASFATAHALGLVSFWSLDRDQVCGQGADYNTCSTVNGANFDFINAMKSVAP